MELQDTKVYLIDCCWIVSPEIYDCSVPRHFDTHLTRVLIGYEGSRNTSDHIYDEDSWLLKTDEAQNRREIHP